MLPRPGEGAPVLSRRTTCWLMGAGILGCAVPTIRGATLSAEPQASESAAITRTIISAPLGAAHAEEDPGERYRRFGARQGVPPLQRSAYESIGALHRGDFARVLENQGFDVSPGLPAAGNVMAVLYRMGADALPALGEALDDATLTKTTTEWPRGRGRSKLWKVNELAALLVRRIADRDFAIEHKGKDVRILDVNVYPELAPQFKKQVLDWYAANCKRTAAERKVADVRSDVLQNRLSAIQWIGEHRENAGQKALIDRIDGILASAEVNSSLDAELASCALALGRIGDKGTIKAVSQACAHLSYWTAHGAASIYHNEDLFRAYQGFALLGKKDEALEELKELYADHAREMDPDAREEYKRQLEAASKW